MKPDLFPAISLNQFHQAAELISPHIIHTPLVHSPTLSQMFGSDIYLKLENLQKTGSFKIRGAAYKIFSRRNEIRSGGVVAASAGNHAQGVALAASRAGLSATIVMPEWASISKQEATCNYGGQVILWGKSIGESLEKAKEIADQGKTFIHPFDDVDIIMGQGTLGLEILEDLPDTQMILAPVGGGGSYRELLRLQKPCLQECRLSGFRPASVRLPQKPFTAAMSKPYALNRPLPMESASDRSEN